MSLTEEIKARAARLLSGPFVVDDATRVFLFAREHNDGRESVKEVGDFIAHRTKRDRGPLTNSARGFAHIMAALLSRVSDGGFMPPDVNRLHPSTPLSLRETLRRSRASDLQKNTGLSLKKAGEVLKRTIDNFQKNADGTYQARFYDDKEYILLRYLSSMLISRYTFDCERLASDLAHILRSNSIISKSQAISFLELRVKIGLFAITALHQSQIALGDGKLALLNAAVGDQKDAVEVRMSHWADFRGKLLRVAAPVFAVKCDPTICVHPDLLQDQSDWNCPLEVDGNGTLSPLR